jgi:hypothetical protein
MRTTIDLPDELFFAAEALASRLGVSRSQLYATAMAEFLAKHSATEVTADSTRSTPPNRAPWLPRFCARNAGRLDWRIGSRCRIQMIGGTPSRIRLS